MGIKKMKKNFVVDKRYFRVVPFFQTVLSVAGTKILEGKIVDKVVPVYSNIVLIVLKKIRENYLVLVRVVFRNSDFVHLVKILKD